MADPIHNKANEEHSLGSDLELRLDPGEDPEVPSLVWEFKEALARQTFGITSHRLVEDTHTDVKAEVVLLDGQVFTIGLSRQGFEVLSLALDNTHPESREPGQFPVFETLDALLRAISPGYNAAWEKSLLERLNALNDLN